VSRSLCKAFFLNSFYPTGKLLFFLTFKMVIALLQNFLFMFIFLNFNNFSSANIFIIFFAFILNSSFIYEYPDVSHQV